MRLPGVKITLRQFEQVTLSLVHAMSIDRGVDVRCGRGMHLISIHT